MRKNVTLQQKHLPELISMTARATTEAGQELHRWLVKESARREKSGQKGGRPRKVAN